MSAEDWTPERVAKLTTLWMQGLSCAQIARQLGGGITRNAVIGKRVRLGLPDRAEPNRNYTKKQRALRVKAAPAPKPIRIADAPRSYSRAPAKGITATRFIDRSLSQCSMFCEGEEGAMGFVCGAPATSGVWCANCVKLVFAPTPPARVGKAA